MVKSLIEKYDQEEIYCKKLGHHLQFNYCRQEQLQFPCASLKRCWQSRLPVDEILMKSYSKDEISSLNVPPISKMNTILSIVLKNKKK